MIRVLSVVAPEQQLWCTLGKHWGSATEFVRRGPNSAEPGRSPSYRAYCKECHRTRNGRAPTAVLNNANHGTVTGRFSVTHPKRAEAYRLLREAKADEGDNPAGFVYCITDGTAVKLGKSADHPQNRLKGLQTGNPRLLSLLGFKQVRDRHAAEAALHARHIAANVLGEWFEPTAAILKEFQIKGLEDAGL